VVWGLGYSDQGFQPKEDVDFGKDFERNVVTSVCSLQAVKE
jgi:hypothetical protein